MQAAYYKEYYYLERNNWWFLARKEILKDQLYRVFKESRNLKILNVGAALGASTVLLQEFGEVTSIEYNQECCDFVNDLLGLGLMQGSITELPFKDSEFDLVCAWDVVEHVEQDELAIKELHRVCKPGGYTFTTVPTFKFLWSEHDVINQHVRRYTMRNYLLLFDKEMAGIYFKSYFNFFLFFPVAIFRITSAWIKRDSKNKQARSDNSRLNNSFISRLLFYIFRSESFFLKRGFHFATGISLMVISRKRIQ